jgi:hypothetical protein
VRKNETEIQHSNIVVSLSDIQREKERASSPFGPVRAGLTTLQITQRVLPTESLSYSVKEAKIIEFKYSEVCVTLRLDTAELAKLSDTTTCETGTDVLN